MRNLFAALHDALASSDNPQIRDVADFLLEQRL